MSRTAEFQALCAAIDPWAPPVEPRLYIQSLRSPTPGLVARLHAAAEADSRGAVGKHLLLGTRGAGKTTELGAIHAALAAHAAYQVTGLDLDRSGVTATRVSAADLLYLCGLTLLGRLPRRRGKAWFKILGRAYAGKAASTLGDVDTNLRALKGIATITGVVTGGLLATPATASAAVAAGAAIAGGLTDVGVALVKRDDHAPSQATAGGRLLDACRDLVRELRDHDDRPPCVLLDGMEKMDGPEGGGFARVFDDDPQIRQAPWAMVIAAPPSTLTTAGLGPTYTHHMVWGFDAGSSQLTELVHALRRFGCLPEAAFAPEAIAHMVDKCGGLPRHLVDIVREALTAAAMAGADRLTLEHARAATHALGHRLSTGLDDPDFAVLERVQRARRQPPRADGATELMAKGLIIPRAPEGIMPVFDLHPLADDLLRELAR